MMAQWSKRARMPVLAERLRGGGADPDVVILERRDERLESFFGTEMNDGVDRRETYGGRFVGE